MINKQGFTLVEILAVVVILAMLMMVGGISVFNVIDESKKKLLEEQIKGLGDTAITYVQKKHFTTCPLEFDAKNPIASQKNKCYREILVSKLIEEGVFENKNDLCKDIVNKPIIVYRYNAGSYSELRSYIPEGTCSY